MFNRVILQGRLTNDVELKQTTSGTAVSTFSVACERDFRTGDGKRETDFFDCVVWKNTAEFVSKYFKKGDMILVSGRLQNRIYQAQDGSNRRITELVVDDVNFCGSKQTETKQHDSGSDFMKVSEDEDGLPFN